MGYRFFIITKGSDSKIHKVPACQTARLINEFPNQKFTIYETLHDAKQATLVIANGAPAKSKFRIMPRPGQPANKNEDLRTATLELTEDRVEKFCF